MQFIRKTCTCISIYTTMCISDSVAVISRDCVCHNFICKYLAFTPCGHSTGPQLQSDMFCVTVKSSLTPDSACNVFVCTIVSVNATGDIGDYRVNTGTHTLQLYTPPVPDPQLIPLVPHHLPKDWHRYGKATVRLHLFADHPRPGSLSPSEASEEEEGEDTNYPEV